MKLFSKILDKSLAFTPITTGRERLPYTISNNSLPFKAFSSTLVNSEKLTPYKAISSGSAIYNMSVLTDTPGTPLNFLPNLSITCRSNPTSNSGLDTGRSLANIGGSLSENTISKILPGFSKEDEERGYFEESTPSIVAFRCLKVEASGHLKYTAACDKDCSLP